MANPSHQMKADLNRSGYEQTDFPSACENCLPDNPYVQVSLFDLHHRANKTLTVYRF